MVVLALWRPLCIWGLLSLGQGVRLGHTDAVATNQLCTRAEGNILGSSAEMMELWFTPGTMRRGRVLLRWQEHVEGKVHHPRRGTSFPPKALKALIADVADSSSGGVAFALLLSLNRLVSKCFKAGGDGRESTCKWVLQTFLQRLQPLPVGLCPCHVVVLLWAQAHLPSAAAHCVILDLA